MPMLSTAGAYHMGSLIPKGVPFTQIANDAITDVNLTATQFRIYAYLMRRANDEARAYPSQRTIAKDLGCDKSTVSVAIGVLVDQGWIVKHGEERHDPVTGHRQRNWYTVHGTRPARLFDTTPDRTDNPTGRIIQPVGSSGQTVREIRTEPYGLSVHKNTQQEHPDNTQLAKPRNFAWEWLTAPEGWNLPTATSAQQKRVGRLAREINATLDHEHIPDNERLATLDQRARAWPLHFPDATLTVDAFVKHMTQLGQPPLRGDRATVDKAQNAAKMRAALEAHYERR